MYALKSKKIFIMSKTKEPFRFRNGSFDLFKQKYRMINRSPIVCLFDFEQWALHLVFYQGQPQLGLRCR